MEGVRELKAPRVETWRLYRSRESGKVIRMERVYTLEKWGDREPAE